MACIFGFPQCHFDDLINPFESCLHPYCASFSSSKITPQRKWKNDWDEGTTNLQQRGLKEGLKAYFLSSSHTIQHWKAFASCRWLNASMLSCQLCMAGLL
jgi:hypothetical protein